MLPSFLTVLLWAFGIVSANRAARCVGGVAANLARLSLAGVMLAAWAHLFGQGLHGPSLWVFILSGCVGFGLGDIGLFEGMTIIGPRLTILLMQCLSAVVGASLEWLWLGTALTPAQILWGLIILIGVVLALAPEDYPHLSRAQWIKGGLLGVLAAVGQGGGAVLSRKAYQVASASGTVIGPGTAAYQRAVGGITIVLIFFLFLQWRSSQDGGANRKPRAWRKAAPWVVLQAIMGPTIGVSCFQWALSTTPSGVVLAIVSTVPLAVMPLTYFLDHDRPSRRALVGGALAVAGAVALALVK